MKSICLICMVLPIWLVAMMDQRRYGLWCGLGAIDGRLQIDDDRKQRFQNITINCPCICELK